MGQATDKKPCIPISGYTSPCQESVKIRTAENIISDSSKKGHFNWGKAIPECCGVINEPNEFLSFRCLIVYYVKSLIQTET